MKKLLQFQNSSKVCSALFLLWATNSVIVLGEHYPVPTARIALINLQSGHLLRTVTNKVNHEVILTQPTNYAESYLFECNASYPLEWNYFGEGAPSTHADVGRHFVDFYNVNSYTYQAVLYLHNLDELQSGRYICRGSQPEQEKLQVHYDLFVPGNGTQMLISNAEKKVFVPESKLMTSLPCEVTDPSVTLQLYKENSWGGFLKLEMNDSIMFRPRKGFIIKMHELPDPFGTYICATPDNNRRRKVHLIPERFRQKYDDGSHFGPKVPVHLSYDYEYNRMLCCNQANSNNGDEVGNANALAPNLQWAACGSVLDCKIKSVCFEEDRCGDSYTWMDPGPLPRGCTGWKLAEGDFGIFKCSTKSVTQYQPFLLNRGNMFVDFEVAPPSESILTMTKISNDPIYLGGEVEYHCNSTRFYFAFGLRWAFKRGNDDIEFIRESSSYVVKDEFPLMSHMRQTKFRILNPDIKAIICFVPIANSPTEWRTVSLPITIMDPIAPKIPPQRPGFSNFQSNRLIHSSPSQNYPTVVEPYSTSRPILMQNHHSMEVIDPTPSVDIDEIMSLGGGKHSTNAHSHPHRPHEMTKIDSFSNQPHQSNAQSQTRDRFPQVTTYPRGPYLPEFAPSQSMHKDPHDLSPSRDRHHEVPRDNYPHPSHGHNHGSGQFGSPLPTIAPEPPARILPITPMPEIITLDNVKNFQNEKYNFPSQSEIEEANYLHRHKFQMRHEGLVPQTTTQRPVFVPAPIDSSASHSHKFSQTSSNDPQYHHSHRYDFKDEKIKYTEKPRYEEFSPASQHKEFKVSSRLELSPQHISKSSTETGRGSSEKSVANSRYSTLHSPQTPSPTPVTQKPFRYFNDKGFLLEKDKLENFGAPIPVKLPQYQRQPVIHYDSREKQYGLRDPLIPVVTKQWKLKSSEEIDHERFAEESPLQSHSHRLQSRPHQPQSQAATLTSTWDRGYSHSHSVSDSNLMKSPKLDVEVSAAEVEDMDSAPNDYYTASLMSSRRNKASSSQHSNKSNGRKSSSAPDTAIRQSSYHRNSGDKKRYPVATPDYDAEQRKYYHQRYPKYESVGGVSTHDLHHSSASASYSPPFAPEQTYLQNENTVRRHGRYNHYVTEDFLKWSKV